MWGAANVVHRGTLITRNAHIRKKRSYILSVFLKSPEKKSKINLKQLKKINDTAEINKTEKKIMKKKHSMNQKQFFKKINKSTQSLSQREILPNFFYETGEHVLW